MAANGQSPTLNQTRAWPDSSRTFVGPGEWRRTAVTVTASVLIGGALVMQSPAAPLAHADRTVSAHDACNSYKPGYVPVIALGTLGELICVAPGYVLAGLNDSNEGRVKPGNLPGLPAGSYRVNPFDPFSDWVIPG